MAGSGLRSALVWCSIVIAEFCFLSQPAAAQGSYADVNGARLYYETEGDGPPLVLIHGWTLNTEFWDDQVPAFRDRYKVIRYDRRGFGRSDGIPDVSADPADLDSLFAILGIESAYVLGHSQGAVSAMGFALAYPHRVKALILHASGPLPGFDLPMTGPDSVPFAEIARLARTEGVESIWPLFENHPLMTNDSLSEEAGERLKRIQGTYKGLDLLTPKPPSTPADLATVARLHEISVPTMVVTGDREMPYLKVVAEVLAYAIPHSTRVVVPGGGHLISLSRPEAFNEAVLEFLDSLAGRVGSD